MIHDSIRNLLEAVELSRTSRRGPPPTVGSDFYKPKDLRRAEITPCT